MNSSTDPQASVLAALITARHTQQRADHHALPWQAIDLDAAYALQHQQGAALGWFDAEVPRAWKSGGGTLAGITHAPLPDAGVVGSPADGRHWSLHQRGIEAEVALRLGRSVDAATAATLDRACAEALIDAMCVSIEVVDSRWTDGWSATPTLLRLADLQSHGALVLGAWQPYSARDWAAQVCEVHIGTQTPQRFVGTHPLGDPAAVLPAWLRHLTREGATVPAGTVVTTGSWVGLLEAQAGDAVRVAFDGLGEAALQL